MNNLTISYLTLRKVIGILGMILGFTCILGGLLFGTGQVEQSISAYYATNMRDVLVGILLIAGAFILSYKGYDKLDYILTRIAGISAIGIVVFPCCTIESGFGILQLSHEVAGPLHFIMSAIFFGTIAALSIFQFTKGDLTNPQKVKRNVVYKVSGYGILLAMITDAILDLGFHVDHIVIVMEIIMLMLFGLSWLTKGEAIFKDQLN